MLCVFYCLNIGRAHFTCIILSLSQNEAGLLETEADGCGSSVCVCVCVCVCAR